MVTMTAATVTPITAGPLSSSEWEFEPSSSSPCSVYQLDHYITSHRYVYTDVIQVSITGNVM